MRVEHSLRALEAEVCGRKCKKLAVHLRMCVSNSKAA